MIVRLALVGWFLLWARIGFPWRSFQWTPSFRRVELIPFAVGSPRTYLLNVLAFIPLGVIGVRLGWHPRTVTLVAAGVSGLTEVSQLFSRGRYPSTTDLILNTSGALIGIAIAITVRHIVRKQSPVVRPAT
jgi:glycopeptide antibiotics resistance protein